MPSKNLKSLMVEVAVVVVMICVVGHLTINFWERYFVKSELAQMKDSLHTLKNTLYTIGNAYDALHINIKNLADGNTKLGSEAIFCQKCKSNNDKRKRQDPLIGRKIRPNLNDEPLIEDEEYDFILKDSRKCGTPSKDHDHVLPKLERETNFMSYQNKKGNNFIMSTIPSVVDKKSVGVAPVKVPVSNASTITRYPTKATGAGTNHECENRKK